MPVKVGVSVTGFSQLARDMRRADKGLAASLKKKMKEAGDIVAQDWRARESWSTRIPGTIRVLSNNKGVKVRGGGKGAPHLASFESDRGEFRHPVFGHRDRWVAQAARPGGLAALEGNLDAVADKAAEALDAWARDAGFH